MLVGGGPDSQHAAHSGGGTESEAPEALIQRGSLAVGQPSSRGTGPGRVVDIAVAPIEVTLADGLHEAVMGGLPGQGDSILIGLQREALHGGILCREAQDATDPTLAEIPGSLFPMGQD